MEYVATSQKPQRLGFLSRILQSKVIPSNRQDRFFPNPNLLSLRVSLHSIFARLTLQLRAVLPSHWSIRPLLLLLRTMLLIPLRPRLDDLARDARLRFRKIEQAYRARRPVLVQTHEGILAPFPQVLPHLRRLLVIDRRLRVLLWRRLRVQIGFGWLLSEEDEATFSRWGARWIRMLSWSWLHLRRCRLSCHQTYWFGCIWFFVTRRRGYV